ncbi:MAG: hypothetical protein LBK58_08820 [Prevotellaceae bacterium]|jgi:hypothetical protein|nr:hypothetical protein [Prevotellaceae bacterium]
MDFKYTIRQIAKIAVGIRENIHTKETTKNALVSPFVQALGYDIFNPSEIISEYDDKIDYALIEDGKPIILIECRHWKQDLTLRDSLLPLYFHSSNAKYGILTNGIIYKFYTEMDEKPFLEIDITDMKDTEIEELRKFQKT